MLAAAECLFLSKLAKCSPVAHQLDLAELSLNILES